MGYSLASMGKIDEAIEQFQAALQIKPDYKPAKTNLDIYLPQKQQFKDENSKKPK